MICQILGEERYKNEAKVRKYAVEIALDKYRNEFWIYRLLKLLKLRWGGNMIQIASFIANLLILGISLTLITVSLFFIWVIVSELYSEIKRRNHGKSKRITW